MDISVNPSELVGRFHTVVKSLDEFNNAEVLPFVKRISEPTDRESCIFGIYYRTVTNARTLLRLTDPSHYQAISMITRSLIELSVDIRLLIMTPDGVEKIIAFDKSERLRAARSIVECIEKSGKTERDLSGYQAFIAVNEQSVFAERERLWPNLGRVDHWSGLNLRRRVELLGAPFDELYKLNYARLSWSVHAGLAGVFGLNPQAFLLLCGTALPVAVDCYIETLGTIIQELNLREADSKIDNKLLLAKRLPFTDNPEEVRRLRETLLA
jgi:hypothetical protein